MNALQKVVTEQGVLGMQFSKLHSKLSTRSSSLTDIATFTEEVLVDIGYSVSVKVKARYPPKRPE